MTKKFKKYSRYYSSGFWGALTASTILFIIYIVEYFLSTSHFSWESFMFPLTLGVFVFWMFTLWFSCLITAVILLLKEKGQKSKPIVLAAISNMIISIPVFLMLEVLLLTMLLLVSLLGTMPS